MEQAAAPAVVASGDITMTDALAGHIVLTLSFAVAACLLMASALVVVGAICKCVGALRQCADFRDSPGKSEHNERP